MKKDFEGRRVMSGTFGELWIDNEYVAEVKQWEANIDMEFADVDKARDLATHKKLMGYEGEGSMTLNKVSSKFPKKISDNLKQGKETKVKMISNVDDPDAFGNERVVIYDAVFNNLPLGNWEVKNLLEDELDFHFTDWDFEDVVI